MMKRVGFENEMIQCPYNISHQIIRHRFQVHLVRCRKSYPTAEMVTCPFNISHRINKQELEWHVSNCSDRQSFEVFRHRDAPVLGLSSTVDKSFCGSTSQLRNRSVVGEETSIIESSEVWDTEVDVPAYNPTEYVERTAILRMPVGLQPAQRNAFRQAERKRLLEMKY